ncbi:MAG: peptidylprolyl isomerase [Bryobacteraceae bacterium]
MKRAKAVGILLLGLFSTSTSGQDLPVQTVADSAIVLSIGDESVTRSEFEQLMKTLGVPTGQAVTPERLRTLVDRIVQVKAFAQEAKRKSLDTDPVSRLEVQFRMQQVLADVELADLVLSLSPTEEAIYRYYSQHQEEFTTIEASHILVRFGGSILPLLPNRSDLTSEDALAHAKSIRRRLAEGDEFAKIAREESDDSSTSSIGGQLGTFGHGRLSAEFEQGAFSLAVGEISDPIRSQYGYHIIQVKRRGLRPFQEVRTQIETQLRRQALGVCHSEVMERTKVVMDKTYFRDLPNRVPSICGIGR